MRKISALLLAAGLLSAPAFAADPAPAAAPAPTPEHTFTANIGLFSQYVFRGLTQTNEKAALQGGVDYSHSSGLYIGTWLSNISWFTDQNVNTVATPIALRTPGAYGVPYAANGNNKAPIEWDIYFGYRGSFADDWSYDVGFLRYEYPGKYDNLGYFKKPNTNEVYGQIGYKWVTAKYSHSLGDTFGVGDAKGSSYLDLTAAVPVEPLDATLTVHVGHQAYRGRQAMFTALPGAARTSYDNSVFSYTDWKLGLNKEFKELGGVNLGIAFTGTNAKGTAVDTTANSTNAIYRNVDGRNIGRSQVILSAQKTF